MKMCKYGKGMHYYPNLQDIYQKNDGRRCCSSSSPVVTVLSGCSRCLVVAGYCWSATSVMGLPMQEFGIWMRSMAQTVGATSTM